MKAEEFELLVNEVLDRRQVPAEDPQLVKLANESDELRAILSCYSLLLDGVGKLEPPRSSIDLKNQIIETLRQQPAEPDVLTFDGARRSSRRYWLGGAAAAVLAICIPLISYFYGDGGWDRPRLATAKRTPSATEAKLAQPSVNVAGPVSSAELTTTKTAPPRLAQYAELARQTTSIVADFTLLVSELSADPQGFADRAKQQSGEDGDSILEQVSEGLAPLANSAVGAFDFLLNVLPEIEPKRS